MNKTFTKSVVNGLAVLALGSMALAAFAAGHDGSDRHFGHNPERMMAHMTERLGLSTEQEQQIKTLLDAQREQSSADQERARELHEALMAQQGNFDAGAAQKIADELGEITTRKTFARASTHAEIAELLTDSQRQQMEQLLQERRGRHESRGRHRQPDAGSS